MYTFKYGDISTLTLSERITTPSIHIQKDDNHWYVPLFEGDKGSVVQSGDYNYTLGGLKVGNFRVAINREKGQEYLSLIADNFYTFEDGVLNCTNNPTITKCDISEVGAFGLYRAFYDCTGLTSVSFPNLTYIDEYGLEYAFYGCTGLTSVSFPSLTVVGEYGLDYAFYGCTGLKEIHFKSSLSGDPQCTASNMGCTNATIYFDL